MRKVAGTVLVATMLLWLLVMPAAWARTVNVRIQDLDYQDGPNNTVFVNPGDKVKWTHRDGQTPHTVTARDRSFDSSPIGGCQIPLRDDCMYEGDTFERAFDKVGTFEYFCKVHESSMTGRVQVVARGGTASTPPSTPASVTPTKTSPSPTGSSPSPTLTTGAPTITPTDSLSGTARAGGPDDGSSNGRIAVAAVGVLVLSAAGFLVYRRFISPS